MLLHGIGGLLVAAAAGYWVLTASQRERGRVKQLGQWLGLVIVVVSVAGAACKLYYLATGGYAGAGVSYLCPFTGKTVTPTPPSR